MKKFIPKTLRKLAGVCQVPLYIVGGAVRDFLAGRPLAGADWDLASAASDEDFSAAAGSCGFTVRAVYPATGTVKVEDEDGTGYEYTRFRSDRYVRGVHAPAEIFFTDDIARDARRRDFCADAVYYDIAADTFADPLGGIGDIQSRTLRTVAPAEKVFGEDGLRLMRLARIAAQTGFTPDAECLAGAKSNCALIRDIVPERIFHELDLLLRADEKAGGADGPYRGLCILRETGVLAHILPELALGDGMPQRADFHRYDVLEHSFRCVRYAQPFVRWAALLHDAGKPLCFLRDGNFHAHPEEGARIAEEILTRLKAPAKLTEETKSLVALHMRDFDLNMRGSKVRREIVRAYPLLEKLLAARLKSVRVHAGGGHIQDAVRNILRIFARLGRAGQVDVVAALPPHLRHFQEVYNASAAADHHAVIAFGRQNPAQRFHSFQYHFQIKYCQLQHRYQILELS